VSTTTDVPSTLRGAGATASDRLVRWLPALVPAQVVMALWVPVQLTVEGSATSTVVAVAVANQLLLLLRALPVLALLSWPLARLRPQRWALGTVGTLWAVFLMFQAFLERYYLTSRVPLGADIYAYNLGEIRTTTGGTWASISVIDHLGIWLPVIVLAMGLWWRSRTVPPSIRPLLLPGLQMIGIVTWALPLAPGARGLESEAARTVATSKTAYFISDSIRWWLAKRDLRQQMLPREEGDAPVDSSVSPADAPDTLSPAPTWSPTAAPVWSPTAAPVDTGATGDA